MHELAITESVVAGVCEAVGGARVVRVVLHIGRLSAVVPDSIRFCFDIASRGTPLENAALEIVETPGRAKCRRCGAEVPLQNLLGSCDCGSVDLEILSGQELLLKAVEVA